MLYRLLIVMLGLFCWIATARARVRRHCCSA